MTTKPRPTAAEVRPAYEALMKVLGVIDDISDEELEDLIYLTSPEDDALATPQTEVDEMSRTIEGVLGMPFRFA